MERRTGERVPSGDVRITRYPQDSGRGDEDVECLVAVGRGEPPLSVVIPGRGHVGTEPDVRTDATFVGHLPEIGLYLGTRRQPVRPVRVRPKRVGVVARRDIAGQT